MRPKLEKAEEEPLGLYEFLDEIFSTALCPNLREISAPGRTSEQGEAVFVRFP